MAESGTIEVADAQVLWIGDDRKPVNPARYYCTSVRTEANWFRRKIDAIAQVPLDGGREQLSINSKNIVLSILSFDLSRWAVRRERGYTSDITKTGSEEGGKLNFLWRVESREISC